MLKEIMEKYIQWCEKCQKDTPHTCEDIGLDEIYTCECGCSHSVRVR